MEDSIFSNRDLQNLIFPLFVEQFLLMLVGIADTFIVSFSSEADVSGVSLVNSFNTVLVFLFTALSSGGAVIISQYTGNGDDKKAEESAGQLLMISIVFSAALSAGILISGSRLLSLLFGKVAPDVMEAGKTYLIITAWSLPALAAYDAGAALCRSAGNARATMYISAAANIINIFGNCIGVFALDSGAAGVAVPSLISRMLSAVAVTAYCFREKNGIHQLVKVALSSMVALFGTYQIAANGVAQSIWSLASIMGLAMAPAYTTVIGRCMGAGDIDSANFYFKKLNKIALLLSILWNAFVFFITPLIVRHSAISPEAKSLVIWLVLIHNMFNGLAYPFAGSLGNGLRAAGDVKFTMLVSIFLTIAARLFFSVLFGLWLNWGVIGIAAGMSINLVLRGILFLWRYQSQKWTKFQVI